MADIKKWISKQLDAGYSPHQIKESLDKAGHESDLVQKVLDEQLDKESKKDLKGLFILLGLIAVTIVLIAVFLGRLLL